MRLEWKTFFWKSFIRKGILELKKQAQSLFWLDIYIFQTTFATQK